MNGFQKNLELEILMETRLLKENQDFLDKAPQGKLYTRVRKTNSSYYWQYKERTTTGWKTVQKNITWDEALILQLARKMLATERTQSCTENLRLLCKLREKYREYDDDGIMARMPDRYAQAFFWEQQKNLEEWMAAPYDKCPYNPQRHIQQTAYGEFVRSKSEAIIANALYAFGIPFHYEEKFTFPNDYGRFYYPDFTIGLPCGDGPVIWEHLGLLSDLGYCESNAKKLNTYQMNDVVIGKNLILTQDDSKGNCNSDLIYDIIETSILPKLKGIKLSDYTNGVARSYGRRT